MSNFSTDLYPGAWAQWRDQLVDAVAADLGAGLTKPQILDKASGRVVDATYSAIWLAAQLNHTDEDLTGRSAVEGLASAVVDQLLVANGPAPTYTALAAALAVATTNIALSGNISVDGQTAANGSRILAAGQTDAKTNGLYVAAAGAWARAADTLAHNVYVPITAGTVNAGTNWLLTTNDPIVVGTTSLAFTSFNPAANPIAPAAVASIKALGRDGALVSIK